MTDYQPRSVFCVIGDVNRDLNRADEVMAGRFDLAGTVLDLGSDPDWLGGPFPADEEWRIEFSKFYYGLDLAHAHAQTGRPDFVDRWLQLVQSWIEQVPVDHDPTDVIARRIQNWTYAWCRFAELGTGSERPLISSSAAEQILGSIGEQLAYLRANLAVERNHRTLELYALLVCALAHPSLDPDGELSRFAGFELYRNLRSDILEDGVHRERSTHYHAIALRSFLGTRVNAERFGLPLPAGFDHSLGLACGFLAAVMRPDGSLPMLSDSDDGDHGDLLLLAAAGLQRPDLEWVATRGKSGLPPADRVVSFPAGGYHVQRSGWGDDITPYEFEHQLIFDVGAVGDSGHGHYDALHVEVAAGGRALLVDPGRYTYSEAGDVNWRHRFKATAAHNTVTVDGLDQVPYRRGKPKGPTSQARFLGSQSGNGIVSLMGEVISPCYDAVHRRRVLFIDQLWWVVEDVLLATEVHRYDLRYHLTPVAQDRTRLIGTDAVESPGLTMLFAAETTARLEIEAGWIAPTYGCRQPAPVISYETTADTTRLVTVIAAIAPDVPRPRHVSLGPTSVEVAWGTMTDRVDWGGQHPNWTRS